jgi:hypothetical protein
LRKIYSFKTAQHPAANKFLMDFVGAWRRKVWTFQAALRQKTRKFVAAGLMRSIPLRLQINKNLQEAVNGSEG